MSVLIDNNLLPLSQLSDNDFFSFFNCDVYNPLISNSADVICEPLKRYVSEIATSNTIEKNRYFNCTIDEFKNKLCTSAEPSDLVIIHLNVQSLNAKLLQFQTFSSILMESVDIFIVSEIWSVNIEFYRNILPGYIYVY